MEKREKVNSSFFPDYFDSPSVGSDDNYSLPFRKEDHERLTELLKTIKGRFIFSSNDHPDIWQLYEGLQFRQAEGYYSISRSPSWISFGELIITHFSLPHLIKTVKRLDGII